MGTSVVNDEGGKLRKRNNCYKAFPCISALLSLCVFLDWCLSLC